MEVDPAALRKFADVLAGQSEHAVKAMLYADRHGSFSSFWEEGLFTTALPAHHEFHRTLVAALAHLADLLDGSRAQLVKAATFYEDTDDAAADLLDRTYPQASRPTISPW
jgi:hypothetical protein